MKIYLASFLEMENFGPGRLIGVANGNKPEHVSCELVFPAVIPSVELLTKYNKMALTTYKEAVEMFVSEYNKQLDLFAEEVMAECKKTDKTPQEVLSLQDGDTLCSWERKSFSSYRAHLARLLENLEYEVVLN